MLRLSKKADYGLIALIHLAAKEPGQSGSAKEIADACRLPLPLLAKVLQKLAKGGFLASVQGTNGGYRLAREAGAISALEVIRAIDGPVFFTSCSPGGGCYQTKNCTVRQPLHLLREQILLLLADTKISAMARDPGARAAGQLAVRSLS
jgi:Rrf2 family protein